MTDQPIQCMVKGCRNPAKNVGWNTDNMLYWENVVLRHALLLPVCIEHFQLAYFLTHDYGGCLYCPKIKIKCGFLKNKRDICARHDKETLPDGYDYKVGEGVTHLCLKRFVSVSNNIEFTFVFDGDVYEIFISNQNFPKYFVRSHDRIVEMMDGVKGR